MRALGWIAAIAGAAVIISRQAPNMEKMCECFFEKMPETFPPKSMYLNILAIREQNERIISLLEKKRKKSAKTK